MLGGLKQPRLTPMFNKLFWLDLSWSPSRAFAMDWGQRFDCFWLGIEHSTSREQREPPS